MGHELNGAHGSEGIATIVPASLPNVRRYSRPLDETVVREFPCLEVVGSPTSLLGRAELRGRYDTPAAAAAICHTAAAHASHPHARHASLIDVVQLMARHGVFSALTTVPPIDQ